MPEQIAPGLFAETVGDIIGGTGTAAAQPPPPVLSPRLRDAPAFPEPGIYFGMSDEVYHAIHACSASGLKDLSMSSMDYWAKSVLNPERDDGENDSVFKALGRAYHVRILLGAEAFERCYAQELTKEQFGDDLVVTVTDIRKRIEELGEKPRGQAKEPLMLQLLGLDLQAKIWDMLVEEHRILNEGREMISAKNWRRIQIAAKMIEADPELSHAFAGGHPEVALFWYDEKTGAPMKAKVDYLKLNSYSDLKSFSNTAQRPVQRAIDFTIANRKYYIPVVVYGDGIAAVKKLVREQGMSAVFRWIDCTHPDDCEGYAEAATKAQREWVWAWAHQPEPEALYVFQQTGVAPVTRGRLMSKGSVWRINQLAVSQLKQKWVQCAKAYGTDPWLDIAPITATTDEALPMSASDFGEPE